MIFDNATIYIIVIGLGIIVLGIMPIVIMNNIQRRRLKKLIKSGNKVLCTIIEVNHTGISLGGKSLYSCLLQPISKQEQIEYGNFKSRKFWGSLFVNRQYSNTFSRTFKNLVVDEKGLIGKELVVYVDINKKDNYAVDRSILNPKKVKRLP